MISSSEFKVLSKIKSGADYDEYKNEPLLNLLLKERLIKEHVVGETYDSVLFDGYELTPLGERAYEEYQSFLVNQQNERDALDIAKEANQLSVKANDLSNEANKISKKSNSLSIGAIVLSAVAIVVSFIEIIVTSCT